MLKYNWMLLLAVVLMLPSTIGTVLSWPKQSYNVTVNGNTYTYTVPSRTLDKKISAEDVLVLRKGLNQLSDARVKCSAGDNSACNEATVSFFSKNKNSKSDIRTSNSENNGGNYLQEMTSTIASLLKPYRIDIWASICGIIAFAVQILANVVFLVQRLSGSEPVR